MTISTASETSSALDWITNRVRAGGVTVSDEFTPTRRPADGIDGSAAEARGGGERELGVPGEKTEVLDPFDPNRRGALLPNVGYRASASGTNHQYVYETNADGLIDRVTVEDLHLKPTGRARFDNARNTPDKLPTDDAGHLIADLFDGSPELDNLISQARAVNRGAGSEWTEMERAWRKALTKESPSVVTNIEIKILYDASKRPTGFDVKYKIDGTSFNSPTPNLVPEID
ncbi:DNA/RNA non-specific endonuclease [Rathayibacter rathayi]|uniref:DNA/RNA non-specific endonuclease n=1 Tax=Rathayibacter rathayi TaxID=33887 RepID=UPI0015E1F9CC|nr:DNA/RNA non-specific endonuclease [Rathayibacter rathayi]